VPLLAGLLWIPSGLITIGLAGETARDREGSGGWSVFVVEEGGDSMEGGGQSGRRVVAGFGGGGIHGWRDALWKWDRGRRTCGRVGRRIAICARVRT
jgi:hypothetical protein